MAAAGRQQGQEELEQLSGRLGQLDLEEETALPVLDLQAARQYAVHLTLDPGTAHPKLRVSEDKKQVKCGDERKNLQDDPQRFNHCLNVLAEQRFSSRFYFEVQVRGKTGWTIGVAKESISRKGVVALSPARGCWAIRMKKQHEYEACPSHKLDPRPPPKKVGVFVDPEERRVSFYDADTAALIYSFPRREFTEKLRPFFNPGPHQKDNSAPLVITAVRK